MEANNKSEVATFREQQELLDQAARQGLYGLAVVANHASITARMERGADHVLKLIAQGKHQEAIVLLDTPAWGVEEGDASCQRGKATL